jgi:hypothetical protein
MPDTQPVSLDDLHNVDLSWVHAMNIAALQDRRFGVDLFWTTGPLAYLFHPMDVNEHLAQALGAQAITWGILSIVTWVLIYRSGFSTRRIGAFCICIALASPWFHFNYMGVENLLATAILLLSALLLLKCFRWPLFLLMVALVPITFLIKGTAGVMALGALAGFDIAMVLIDRRRALLCCLSSAAIVPSIAGLLGAFVPGTTSIQRYVNGFVEIASNFSVAMSEVGPATEQLAAVMIVVILATLFFVCSRRRDRSVILLIPFCIPFLVSVKHGFVRQDYHVVNYFCFVLVMLGIFLLFVEWRKVGSFLPVSVGMVLALCSIPTILRTSLRDTAAEATGWANIERVRYMVHHSVEPNPTNREPVFSRDTFLPLNAAQFQLIGMKPVNIVSSDFVSAPLHRLNLIPLPVVQPYQAYTPYLDRQNADWLKIHGSENVLLEWLTVAGRHPLSNPATLLSLYQVYETQLRGPASLLLRRRTTPRFTNLVTERYDHRDSRSDIVLPQGPHPIFMLVQFELTMKGRVMKALYHIPEVDMTLTSDSGERFAQRIVPELMRTPTLITDFPSSLEGAAQLFSDRLDSLGRFNQVSFSGPGLVYYKNIVRVEFLRAQ